MINPRIIRCIRPAIGAPAADGFQDKGMPFGAQFPPLQRSFYSLGTQPAMGHTGSEAQRQIGIDKLGLLCSFPFFRIAVGQAGFF